MTEQRSTTHKPHIPGAKPQGRNVIAVASGKGGVGKTWFSTTLCHALAKAGKRVLLFDGDLGLANVDVQLGIMPQKDLNDYIQGTLPLHRVITHYSDGGYDIIVGRSGQASLAALPQERLDKICSDLIEVGKAYDMVVLDLGAGIDKTVRTLASCAATTLLVTNDEPTAMTDAYAYIKLAHRAGLSQGIHVVVNNATSYNEGARTHKTLGKAALKFLGLELHLAGIIRMDRHVKECIRYQQPILMRHPNCEAAEDISHITRQVQEILATQ